MMPGGYEEDEWYAEGYNRGGYGYVRPPPVDLLVPGAGGAAGARHRSRSVGGQPAPNVYVYTQQRNDNENIDAAAGGPRGRQSRRDNMNRVEDRLEDIESEIRRVARSRSRVADDRWQEPVVRADMQIQLLEREREDRRALEMRMMELERTREIERERDNERLRRAQRKFEQLEAERIRDGESKDRFEREEELIKKRAELRRLKDKIERDEEEAKLKARDAEWKKQLEIERLKDEEKRKAAEIRRKEERDRILAQKDKEEADAKAERRRIALEIEEKEKEEEEERKLIVAQFQAKQASKKKAEEEALAKALADAEKKKKDEKDKEAALRAKFKAEDEAKKLKEKEEEEMWKLKLKRKEEAEKAAKKKKEEELEEEMTKKLSQFGFQNNQIQAMIHPKKADQLPAGALPNRPAVAGYLAGASSPMYVKVHRDHIDIKTLEYFQLPWEYDAHDHRYIIILQEMEERETDILFEHTRKLRTRTQLTIEDRGRDSRGNADYAFVRRRKPSASPNRKRSKSARRVSLFSLV